MVRFAFKILGSYCGSPSIWADFLRVVYTQAGRFFFQNPPQLRREKTDFSESNGKDKRKGMEDGRYGTLSVEDLGFLLRISVDLG